MMFPLGINGGSRMKITLKIQANFSGSRNLKIGHDPADVSGIRVEGDRVSRGRNTKSSRGRAEPTYRLISS